MIVWEQLQLRRMTSGLRHLGVIITCTLSATCCSLSDRGTQGDGFEITRRSMEYQYRHTNSFQLRRASILTARSETIEFSVGALLLLRILFSETIIIPTLFTC